MGTQIHYGVGYGLEIARDKFESDMWDAVEDDFDLLEVHISGNYWLKQEGNTIVTVKALTKEEDGYGSSDFSFLLNLKNRLKVKKAGEKQLSELAERFHFSYKPQWYVWSYQG